MRLVDIVVQSSATLRMPVDGTFRELPAAGSIAPAVKRCDLRYILDRTASRQCGAVMFERNGLLARPEELEPLPERPFWLECYSDGDEVKLGDESLGRRMGFLVEPDEGGLSGSISSVAEAINGEACLVAGSLAFDLRPTSRDDRAGCRIHHQDSAEIEGLLANVRLMLSQQWQDYAVATGLGRTDFVKMQAELCWAGVPLVFSFNALMKARGALASRRSDLSRLNAARARRGKPPLMDHIEISVNLSEPRQARTGGPRGERRTPRLHFVRGHTVHRGGGSFWRSSHFRGEGGATPVRTVSVTAGRRRTQHAHA